MVGLLTTIDEQTRRVPIHSVPERLLHCQATALGLPLWKIEIPWPCPDDVYRAAVADVAQRAARDGIATIAFGDLFLPDIRAYREGILRGTGIEPIFPLWGWDTGDLATQVLAAGIKATVACIDQTRLEAHLAGSLYDAAFLGRLPPGVDPCGENGEFHTFVWDGPGFDAPISIRVEGVIEDGRFVFADIALAASS